MRLFPLFRRLNWKLTLSYTLVTVGTLLVLELCILLGIQIVASTPALAWSLAIAVRAEALPPLQDILQQESLDVSQLEGRLVSWFPVTENLSELQILPLASDGHAVVLDSAGRLIASQPVIPGVGTGEILDAKRILMLEDILPAALSGETNVARLSRRDGALITIALPVTSENGQLLGVLVIHTRQTRTLADNLNGILQLIGVSFAVFTCLAGVIGTAFGFFTARGLTRRLGRVAKVSAAWGQGNFHQVIQDESPDELGQLAQQLNGMSQQLQELMLARQQLATLNERNRLARDLHDSVKQQVFAISMNLGAVQSLWERNPEAALSRLEATTQLAHQTQKELTDLIQALRPSALETQSLAQVLPRLIDDWGALHGIQTVFRMDGSAVISPLVEDALFRVAQEALANTAKHSGASQLKLELQCDATHITLKIEDNGHGFDAEHPNSGFGLRSMQERMEDLGGTLTLSSDAFGTRLTATIPPGE